MTTMPLKTELRSARDVMYIYIVLLDVN